MYFLINRIIVTKNQEVWENCNCFSNQATRMLHKLQTVGEVIAFEESFNILRQLCKLWWRYFCFCINSKFLEYSLLDTTFLSVKITELLQEVTRAPTQRTKFRKCNFLNKIPRSHFYSPRFKSSTSLKTIFLDLIWYSSCK